MPENHATPPRYALLPGNVILNDFFKDRIVQIIGLKCDIFIKKIFDFKVLYVINPKLTLRDYVPKPYPEIEQKWVNYFKFKY